MEKKPLIAFGWLRALLFLLLLLPVGYLSNLLAQTINDTNTAENTTATLDYEYFISATCFVLLVIVFRLVIDKRSIKSMGLSFKGFESDAGAGFFTGVLLLSVGSLVLIALGYLHFTTIELNEQSLLLNLLLFIVVAFSEELIFRGYILNNLLDSFKQWPALIISALVFALVHTANPGANWLPVVNIFIAGFLLGVNYIYTRNLWFSIMFHLSWNFFQGPVYGFEVSGYATKGLFVQFIEGPQWLTGGNFGFEGSVIASVLTLLAFGWFTQYYRRNLRNQDQVSKL